LLENAAAAVRNRMMSEKGEGDVRRCFGSISRGSQEHLLMPLFCTRNYWGSLSRFKRSETPRVQADRRELKSHWIWAGAAEETAYPTVQDAEGGLLILYGTGVVLSRAR
jgi:hypothetical protein